MLKSESYKKGIVLSTGLNIFVKGILFFNTIVVAWFFGTSIDTDLYFYIFSTITLISALVNGMDLAVVLPEGMHIQEEKGKQEAMKFYNFFGFCYLVTGILIFLVLFFFSVPIYTKISSFNEVILSAHSSLLLVSSLLPLLIILTNYFTSVLTTLKYFTAPLIANGIAQLFALGSLIIFHDSLGVVSVLYGMAAGYLLNIALLLLFMHLKLQWQFIFSSRHIAKRIKKNLASVQLGNLATFSFNYGIIVVLSSLPVGVYSAYNYSMQILNIPSSFIVGQAAAVAGIKFNELAAKNLTKEFNRIFLQSVEILLFLIVPFCCLAHLYANSVVNILYVRGGFTEESAEKVVYFIQYLIFLAPCFTLNTLITRVMTAGKKVSQTFFFQLGFNLTALMLMVFFTSVFQEKGFIISMLVSYYIYVTIVCIFIFKWLMPFIKYTGVIKTLAVIFLFNVPFFLVFYYLFDQHQSIYGFLLISAGYYLVVLLVNHFVKLNKTADSYFSGLVRVLISKKN